MNILHVLSQFEVTGAESYAVSLIDQQIRSGHSAIVISDTLTLTTPAEYIPLPVGQRSYVNRIRNVSAIVEIIRKHSIDIIHAHSRAASWVAYVASKLTGTPFVSTVHGRQHVHASSKAFSIYGNDIIAVCSDIKDHLVSDLRLDPASIVVIPNCIPLDWWASGEGASQRANVAADESVVLFPGRLTGPKGDVVRLLLSEVVPRLLSRTKIRFKIVGGMITPKDIPRMVSDLNVRYGAEIAEWQGFQPDPRRLLEGADLIIGSGRVVPESLVLRKPVIAFGESSYIGPITPDSFENGAKTNFGDAGHPSICDPDRVAAEILRVLHQSGAEHETDRLAELARSKFDSPVVARKVMRMYHRAYARTHSPHSIPVLMYHQVLKSPAGSSPHGIWVTANQFTEQLRSLRRRGFEAITFADYSRFLRGEFALPKKPIILTFDDGYEDNYSVAFPLLQEFGFKAVIFVVTDKSRRTNFWDHDVPSAPLLTPSQLKELAGSGIEIGSHTVTHPHLTQIPSKDIGRELHDSRDSLEQILGSPVVSFAYPYGEADETTKEHVRETGYEFAAAADSGPISIYQDFFEIRRTQVFPWTKKAGFWKKSLPLYSRYRTFKASK